MYYVSRLCLSVRSITANVFGLGVVAEIEKQKYQNGTEVK